MADPHLVRLKNHFGRGVDESVLAAVLEMCGGNFQSAVDFLTPTADDQLVIQPGAANSNEVQLPPDYMQAARKATASVKEAIAQACVGPMKQLMLDIREVFFQEKVSTPQHWAYVRHGRDFKSASSSKPTRVEITVSSSSTTSVSGCTTATPEFSSSMEVEGRCERDTEPISVLKPAPSTTSSTNLDEYKWPLYISTLLMMLAKSIEISKGSRSRILASLWAAGYFTLAEFLIDKYPLIFSLPEILRGLQILDYPRSSRAITKKLLRLEKLGCKKRKYMGMLRGRINDMKLEMLPTGSVSGSLANRMRRWCGTINPENLAFFALNMPKQPWKDLADLIHLKPSDFQLPWFLPVMFGEKAPEGSILAQVGDNQLATDGTNLVDFLTTSGAHIPYSFLRAKLTTIPDAAKPLIAAYSPLDTLIWYHEDLDDETDHVINKRLIQLLQAGEVPKFNYGKLMERIMHFKSQKTHECTQIFELLMPIAEQRLTSMSLELEPPVVVAGDASYSMDVAVRTATIIGAVISLLADESQLKFFHVSSFDPPIVPSTIREVIHVAETVRADNLTAPGCLIEPYLRDRKVVKCFVIVTDEVENAKHGAYYFPELFSRYYKEVYPAEIVFVSFLENLNKKGRMVTALEEMGFQPIQFLLDGRRPDLSKLDSIIGVISFRSESMYNEIERIATAFKIDHDLSALTESITKTPLAKK